MCGSNEASQLALKNVELVAEPRRSAALDVAVIDVVACGSSFTVAVTRQGEMMGWGAGEFGQVGSPVVIKQAVPRVIRGLPSCTRIRRVAAGTAHVLALCEQYQVYSFGIGLHGALGHNSDESMCELSAAAILPSTATTVTVFTTPCSRRLAATWVLGWRMHACHSRITAAAAAVHPPIPL